MLGRDDKQVLKPQKISSDIHSSIDKLHSVFEKILDKIAAYSHELANKEQALSEALEREEKNFSDIRTKLSTLDTTYNLWKDIDKELKEANQLSETMTLSVLSLSLIPALNLSSAVSKQDDSINDISRRLEAHQLFFQSKRFDAEVAMTVAKKVLSQLEAKAVATIHSTTDNYVQTLRTLDSEMNPLLIELKNKNALISSALSQKKTAEIKIHIQSLENVYSQFENKIKQFSETLNSSEQFILNVKTANLANNIPAISDAINRHECLMKDFMATKKAMPAIVGDICKQTNALISSLNKPSENKPIVSTPQAMFSASAASSSSATSWSTTPQDRLKLKR